MVSNDVRARRLKRVNKYINKALLNTNNKTIIKGNLVDLLQHLNTCDIFIGGSTGPLHLAGILNKKTVAFYPNLQSSTALRWQTLNEAKNRLAFSPPKNIIENMNAIKIAPIINEINLKFLQPRLSNYKQ